MGSWARRSRRSTRSATGWCAIMPWSWGSPRSSPEQCLAFARRLDAEAGDDPARGDRAAAELEKARAYGDYQRMLLEAGRVDFGAQIGLALRLLRERPYLRREYQDRFRLLLVD